MKYFVLLTIFFGLIISCVEQPVTEIEFTEEALAEQEENERCKNENKRSIASSAPLELNCHDLQAYDCDIRNFLPEKNLKDEEEIESCIGSQCKKFKRYNFSTASALDSDSLAVEEDFLLGGQYNYQEARCWYLQNPKIQASADKLELAIQNSMDVCESMQDLAL